MEWRKAKKRHFWFHLLVSVNSAGFVSRTYRRNKIDPSNAICDPLRMTLIDQHQSELTQACSTYKVKKLYAFGSVLSDRFNEKSDVDLAVDFDRDSFEGSFLQFLNFKNTLEEIFHRHVDLVPLGSIRNQVFLRTLNQTKRCIYAA
jgi:predicted nucleotidyltransferase